MQLVMDSIPHIRTFACTRFFACLVNEFIQVIMAPAQGTPSSMHLQESDLLRQADLCGNRTESMHALRLLQRHKKPGQEVRTLLPPPVL